MSYKYETHLHTKEGSACARNTGAEMAYAAKEAGYAGIIVTDHNWGGNTAVDRSLPWKDWVELFCRGYESAKKAGDAIGLDVFFGWEAGYQGTEFLIYGLDKQWLLTHPEIREASVQEQFAMVSGDGGMIIHAHPYRKESYIPEIRLYPEYIHGVEVINATHSNSKSISHNDPEFNTLAYAYAKKYNFPMTAGSDIHSKQLFGGGMIFSESVKDIQDFIKKVKHSEWFSLTDGERNYKQNFLM